MIPPVHQKDYSVCGVTILLVDDDSCSVSRIHELLTYSDLKEFSLSCVTSLPSAVNKFFGNAHDVCIIDSASKRSSEFLAQARQVGCTIPMIVVTSADASEVLEAFHAGAADCLVRSDIDSRVLEQTICRVIQDSRAAANRLDMENRYLGLVENANDIIYTHDLDGNYTSANRAAEELTGYTQQEILRLNAKDVVAEEFLEMSRQMFERKLDAQSETTYEIELITKSGRHVPVEVNTHLIYNAGRPVAVQGIARDITQRRAYESALRESEQRYRELFENANDIVYVHDLQGNFTALNKAGELITGYSCEEALQLNLSQVLAPEHVSHALSMITQKTSLDPATTYELDIIAKSGVRVSLEVSSRTIFVNGKAVAIQGIGRDITERKRSEEALRESEERYQQLVELSPDGIVVHRNGIISFVNTAGLRLMGAPNAESIVGQSIYGFIDESQHSYFEERVAKLQEGENVPSVEVRGRKWDGSKVECEVLSVPFRAGGIAAVQVVVRDITERKQVAQKLNEANCRALAEYERLVRRITVLGQSLGNTRDLTSALRAVRDFTIASVPCDGMVISLYDADQSTRKPVYAWVDDNEIEAEDLAIPVGKGMAGRAIRSGEIVIENRYGACVTFANSQAIGDCTGDKIPQAALCAPMVIMGRTVGCIEIQSYQPDAYSQEHKTAMTMAASLTANAVENVMLMDRERLQADQLRQSQKMEAVGQLAGGVAHDFNNLLTAIGGYSDLGMRRLNDSDPLRRNLEEIKRASTRAGSLTRQLLAFSRKQMLQPKVIDLNTIVGEVDKMLRRLIGEDIDFITILESAPCLVKADPGQIEQVLVNLAVNARDAMPRGGKLTIQTNHVYLDEAYARTHVAVQSGHYILMAVSDTGIGIDLETQKRVFEPFFTTKEVGKGTGLGLSTVYGIVKQSGGSIWVYSEPGKGTAFKVYLPAINTIVETEQKPTISETFGGWETVLLVEDEHIVRNLACEILEMHGYRVLTASDGEKACRVCEEYPEEINLMITDVVMPVMSGRELAERVAQRRPRMAVLYMSGYTDDAIVRHGVLDHDMPFLQKPFTPDAFARKVRDVLEQNQPLVCLEEV